MNDVRLVSLLSPRPSLVKVGQVPKTVECLLGAAESSYLLSGPFFSKLREIWNQPEVEILGCIQKFPD
jgi:hypothetical protein